MRRVQVRTKFHYNACLEQTLRTLRLLKANLSNSGGVSFTLVGDTEKPPKDIEQPLRLLGISYSTQDDPDALDFRDGAFLTMPWSLDKGPIPESHMSYKVKDLRPQKPKRILWYMYAMTIGGVERVNHLLMKDFQEVEHHVWIPELAESLEMETKFRQEAKVFIGDEGWEEAKEGVDLIISQGPLHRPVNSRTLIVWHGDLEYTARLMNTQEAEYVAVSSNCLRCFPYGVRDKVRVIPNGVDPERLRATRSRDSIREEWGYQGDDFLIGYVGRLSEEKRAWVAAVLAKNLGPKAHAVIVGQGSSEKELRKKTARYTDRVQFIGPREDIGNVFSALDVVVVASEFEGFCKVALESWLSETPLLATSVGVMPYFQEIAGDLETYREIPLALKADEMSAISQSLVEWKRVCKTEEIRRLALEHLSHAAMIQSWREVVGISS